MHRGFFRGAMRLAIVAARQLALATACVLLQAPWSTASAVFRTTQYPQRHVRERHKQRRISKLLVCMRQIWVAVPV